VLALRSGGAFRGVAELEWSCNPLSVLTGTLSVVLSRRRSVRVARISPGAGLNNSQRYTVLFGQGLSVTALQSAAVFATIANDGVRLTPRLIKAVTGPDGQLQEQPDGTKTRVVSRQDREAVAADAGERGRRQRDGGQGLDPGYRVAGKTGTADAYDEKCGCYSGYTASFVGMAPADNPRLVVAAMSCSSNRSAATTAGPWPPRCSRT